MSTSPLMIALSDCKTYEEFQATLRLANAVWWCIYGTSK
jgi:hypothetical protein